MIPACFKHPVDSDPDFLEAHSCLESVRIWASSLKCNSPLSNLDHSAAIFKWPGQLLCENELAQNMIRCIILPISIFFHLCVEANSPFYMIIRTQQKLFCLLLFLLQYLLRYMPMHYHNECYLWNNHRQKSNVLQLVCVGDQSRSCRLTAQHPGMSTTLPSSVSPSKSLRLQSVPSPRSWINKLNKTVPSTDSCGTPLAIGCQLDSALRKFWLLVPLCFNKIHGTVEH